MKLLIDAQLPPALARALKEIGEDAYPVRELGLRDADDTTIWDYAIENKMVLITKDEDFSERFLVSKNAPEIVWLRIGNTSNRTLIEWFVPLWPEVLRRLNASERLIEVREKYHHF